jgi:hypothetical protein
MCAGQGGRPKRTFRANRYVRFTAESGHTLADGPLENTFKSTGESAKRVRRSKREAAPAAAVIKGGEPFG